MRRALLLALGVALATRSSADAVLLEGRGDGATECWVALDVTGRKPVETPRTRGQKARVVQEACAGACEFSASVCLNVERPGCVPAELADVHVLGKARLDRPLANTPVRVCGRSGSLVLPLRSGRRAARKIVLLARSEAGARDVDVITFLCVPPPPGDTCARCGDGAVGSGESCDDGNALNDDGCDSNCTPTGCGNGVRTSGERCDDANAVDGDGCDGNCTLTGCGNSIVTAGEECDPPGAISPDRFCTSTCRQEALEPCACGAPTPPRLVIATAARAGSCGEATNLTGQPHGAIACGGLYIGGGSATVEQPIPIPVGTESVFGVLCSGNRLTLGRASIDAAFGAHRCTAPGCRFGPPLPAPNTLSESLSACIISTIVGPVSGEALCDTGATRISIPLAAEVFLTGQDQAPSEPGLQACPVCLAGRCRGGANHGGACASQGEGPATSRDCPPEGPPLDEVTLDLDFSTEPLAWRAVPSGAQPRVFCGYCRDADVTSAFAEPPVACLWGGAPLATCSEPFESCEQRATGAFGPDGGGVTTITVSGVAGGGLVAGVPSDAVLASLFCVPPVAGDVINNNVDLPGPAALTLPVRMTLEAQ